MRFLFAIPKNKYALFGYRDTAPSVPYLGVAYLISMLRKEGVEVNLYNELSGKNYNDLFQLIQNFQPDLIGVPIFASLNRNFAYELIRKIKENTEIPLVAGGVHVSIIKKMVLEETKADFAIKHEGEFPLIELINELKNPEPKFEGIKNLIWRTNGQIIENENRPFITDLDQLPFPQFDLFDINDYHYPGVPDSESIIPLISSRGCPFECNFCCVKHLMGRVFRKRSAENVFEEIKHRYSQRFSQFDFNDDCFTLDRVRAERILDLITDSGLKIKFQFYIGLRADTVNPGILRKLKEAGCSFICYGAESGNEKILKSIKKEFSLKQVRDAIRWTNEAGIANAANFIIGHQGETYQTAMDSINFAKSLPANFVNFFNLIPYPGTEVFEWTRKNACFITDEQDFFGEIAYFDNQPVFETKEFTKPQRIKVTRMGFNLHEYTVLRYRFGKAIGTLLFFLTRNNFLRIFLARFVVKNKIGYNLAALLFRKLHKG